MFQAMNKNHMQKSGIRKSLVIGITVVAAVVALVMVRQLSSAVSEVKPVIAEFMEAGAAKDVEAACACWAPWSATEEEIADLMANSYDVFAGYEWFDINEWYVHSGGATTSCCASGVLVHSGGQSLSLETSLQKEGEIWKIVGIRIGSTARGTVTRPPQSGDYWHWR